LFSKKRRERMRKLLKYVHRTSVNRYKDKEIIEVFALHPVNIMHMPRPSSERIVFGKNVIIDGLHILYRLLHREVPEIEVTIYPEICVHDINSLYGIIYGKNKDIYRYYLIHSHSKE